MPVEFLGKFCPKSRWVGKGFLVQPLIIPPGADPGASLILHINELLLWVFLLHKLTFLSDSTEHNERHPEPLSEHEQGPQGMWCTHIHET